MNPAQDRLTNALSDRYRIEHELGAGGMATVYLAEDLKHGRKVAIKVLHPELSAVIGGDRFLTEIKVTANLQHPHILGLIDSGEADGLLYYVMPYVSGESLRSRLGRDKQLPIDDALRLSKEVASALDYAHRQGVVHRDVKPENILLQDGSALVADFGIALAVLQAGGSRMTQTGMSLGTPAYMSPEQAMGERDIGARSDVYALGAMTYEMLTGEPPFTGLNSQAIVAKVLTETPPPLRPKRPTVSSTVEHAVLTALQKLPADRFGTAKDFADALEGKGGHYAATVLTPAARPSSPSRLSRPAMLAGAALVAAAGIAGWSLHRAPAVPTTRAWQFPLTFPDSAPPVDVPSLSADGNLLAYTAMTTSGTQIWLRRSSALAPTPVVGSEGGSIPVLSPDGTRVAFETSRGALAILPVTGGVPTRLLDLPLRNTGNWDGAEHFICACETGLARISMSGGAPEQLTTVDTAAGEGYHVDPVVLPEGRGIIFSIYPRVSEDISKTEIAMVGPGGGMVTRLMPGFYAQYAAPDHLIATRHDGTIVVATFDPVARKITSTPVPIVSGLSVSVLTSSGYSSVASTGRMVYVSRNPGDLADLVRVQPGGTATPLVEGWHANFQYAALSGDGKQLVVGMYTASTEELSVRNLVTGASARIAIPDAQARGPRFLPDGSVLFATVGPTGGSVYRAVPGSTLPPERLVTGALLIRSAVMSPDGHALYYTRYQGTESDVYLHGIDAGQAPDQPVLAAAALEAVTDISPDGRWLAYYSDESGKVELYVRSTDRSRAEKWQVSANGIGRRGDARWSRDGRELYYPSADSMIAVHTPSGPTFEIAGRRALFSMKPYSGHFDVFPDGSFMMIEPRPPKAGSTEMVMVEDWHSLLPR